MKIYGAWQNKIRTRRNAPNRLTRGRCGDKCRSRLTNGREVKQGALRRQ